MSGGKGLNKIKGVITQTGQDEMDGDWLADVFRSAFATLVSCSHNKQLLPIVVLTWMMHKSTGLYLYKYKIWSS